MAYKWKPSKSQRRAFAERMNNDPAYAAAYYARKEERKAKNRADSRFDYDSAGGFYVPTLLQSDFANKMLKKPHLTDEQKEACFEVCNAYCFQRKTHHDYIHIVNELIRTINGSQL